MSYKKTQEDNTTKIMKKAHEQNEIFIKNMESIKKKTKQTLELKNSMDKMKKCNRDHLQQIRANGRQNK